MLGKCALFGRLTLDAVHLTPKPSLPALMYGTAWKTTDTATLVYAALKNGFTAIDTAAQPKHYREDLVGEGLRQAISERIVERSDVFVQTKFTSVHGQDLKNMPYDASLSVAEQVKASVQSSLKNFDCSQAGDLGEAGTPYLDSLVLHSPLQTMEDTLEAWHTLETFVPHQIRTLGISNVSLAILQQLYERASIKPTVVQNRFYAATGFDVELRRFCTDRGILYQSFWTLSANPKLLRSKPVQNMAARVGVSLQAALYCCVIGLENTVVLNGTTDTTHMQADWRALELVRDSALADSSAWRADIEAFRDLLSRR